MAEALVSTILEQLASMTNIEKMKLIVGVDEVKKLIENLSSIQAVLEDAESKQLKDGRVRHWLNKLQGTSYDIDDMLDEWNMITAQKLRINEVEKAPNLLKKVCSLVSTHISCSIPVVLHQNFALRIEEINKTLDAIVQEISDFNFSLIEVTRVEQQMSSSVIYLPKVCGKDYDKNTVVNHLLNESSQAPTVSVISIIERIGIEKTTLAKQVFEDDEVNTHFHEKIWVDLFKNFDEIIIAKAILESLKKNDTPSPEKLETLLEKISQCLERKKFLLVLNDMWIEIPEIREKFKLSFERCCPGSIILVTTSTFKTAKMIGTSNTILLGNEWQSSLLLARQTELFRKNTIEDKMLYMECWFLFIKVAFSTLTWEERRSLGNMYGKFVGTCAGLPFAVMMLGSLLGLKTKPEQWRSIHDEIVKLEEMDTQFPTTLLLCYYDLPSKLRKCFSYCGIFPKNHVIYKDKLIKLWIAQGYINGEGKKDMELVGEEYFEILAMRYFFQDFERSAYDGSIIRCKMHNTVHDFAQFLMMNLDKENLTIKDDDHRHLMIRTDSISLSDSYRKKKLRSLVVNKKDIEGDLSELFELTCLRTLDLSECLFGEISEKIKNLIHLRYLNLSHNVKIEELPEALCELYNLQILDVSNCYCLHKLPHGIGKLINLRHLINHRTCLSYTPRGIKSLHCLRTLKKFVASDDKSNKEVGSFECLENLQHLEGFLSITGLGNVIDVKEIGKGKLEDKRKLYCLSLRFDGWACDTDEKIFEALNPPPNLEELVIQCYTGKTMHLGRIMNLTKLRMLKLTSCLEFEKLPSLGKLSSLESLIICNMRSVETVDDTFLGIDGLPSDTSMVVFPKLRYLKFWNMEKWEKLMWSPSFKNVKIMPFLRYLVLDSCPKLKSLSLLGQLPSLESLAVKRMKNVNSIGNEFLGATSHSSTLMVYTFPQLISLEFEEMGEWEEWEVKWEQGVMPNLLSLKFHSCPKLKELPEKVLHRPALRNLIIKECSIIGDLYHKETGMDWYKISHILNIQIDSKYMRGRGF